MKYRKKPVVVDAIQLSERTIISIFDFIGEAKNYPECKIAGIDPADGLFKIRTLEGTMVANIGDWIIKTATGQFYPCKPDFFEKTYEKVGDNTDA